LARTRLLIVDDHEVFRKGLRSLVESSADLEICGEASNGLEAVEAARKLLPDVIVMDISMPHMNGLEATKQIRKEIPQSRVLVLSQHDSSHIVTAAIEAGAAGYVTKSQVAHYLLVALEAVAAGQSFPWTDAEAVPLNGKRAGVKE
jgi:DNA-binding NarL/FixJ family response regulator